MYKFSTIAILGITANLTIAASHVDAATLTISTVAAQNGAFSLPRETRTDSGISQVENVTSFYDPTNEAMFDVSYSARAQTSYSALKTEASISLTTSDLDPTVFLANKEAEEAFLIEDVENGFLTQEEADEFISLGFLPQFTTSRAQAYIQDRWIIEGGETGTEGTVTLSFELDGNTVSSDTSGGRTFFSGAAFAETKVELFKRETGDGDVSPIGGLVISQDAFTAPSNGFVDQLITLERTFTYGDPFDFYLNMTSFAILDFAGTDLLSSDFSASTSFFNTLDLTNITVSDSSGAVIPFALATDSEADVFTSFAALNAPTNPVNPTPPNTSAVPLPAGLPMLFAGLGALGLIRRRT